MPCLVIYSVHRRHCFLSVSTLTSKKISATLFVVCMSLNTFFLPFSGSLTCNYMNRICPVAGYTVNTPSTPYCLFVTAENVPFTFFPTLKPLNMLGASLFVVCLLLNTFFLLFFCNLTCKCISGIYLSAD